MRNSGVIYGAAAYSLWGFLPLYLKFIPATPQWQLMAHRLVWSFVFLVVIISLRRNWQWLKEIGNRRTIGVYVLASVLLMVNWSIYLWGVTSGYVLEASLGYFINPLVNVLLGVVFLKEKLRPFQWLPVFLAAMGVLYLTLSQGSLPWLALALAFTFGIYGFVKKKAPLNSLHGLTLETSVMLIPMAGALLAAEAVGTGVFGHLGMPGDLLLLFLGVITAVPLLLFSAAAQMVPLTTMGILQYLSPTISFVTGIVVFHEPFSYSKWVGFSLIWLALVFYSGEGIFQTRKNIVKSRQPSQAV
jgi:chloramphenicol-sensitive protein RarD